MQSNLWNTIVGQDDAVGRLRKAVQTGTLSHAYLFSGPEGVGKTTLATALAAALNCGDGGCGVCPSCRKIIKRNHPDVSYTSPKGNHLGIDQIREITGRFHLKPFEGVWKVYVIESVSSMTQEAANALLKGLEEPPPQVIFILTTSNIEGVMQTVVSRCQIIQLRRVPQTEIEHALKTEYELSAEEAVLIARLSGGVFNRAVEMAQDEETLKIRGAILDLISQIPGKDILGLFQLKDELLTLTKSQVNEILKWLFSWCRDAFVLKETQDESLLINFDHKESLESFNKKFSGNDLIAMIDVLRESERALRYNINKELLLERTLISIGGLLSEEVV